MKQLILLTGIVLVCGKTWSQTGTGGGLLFPDSGAIIKIKNEPRFVLTLHGGYAVALGTTFKFYPDDIISIVATQPATGAPTKQVTSQSTTKGLGEGFRYGGGISYVINDFINVGLDFDYFHSSISRTKDSIMQQAQANPANGASTTDFKQQYTISYDTRLLTITPNVTFKAISRPKFFIYNKVGMIFTFRPNSLQQETQKDNWTMNWQGFSRDSSATAYKRYSWGIRNPSVGFMGAVGAQVKLMERVRAYAELQFSHVLFAVRNRVLTSYTVDGAETIKGLSVNQREIEFQKTVTSDTSIPDSNKPAVAVTQRFPLTYAGLQLGLAYRF